MPKRTVHIWRIKFQQLYSNLNILAKTLSSDEPDRADRFHFEKDKSHFFVFRSALRTIIGRYLNCEPHQIHFHYGEYGKPYLTVTYKGGAFCFKVAHSNQLALFGFTRNHKLGIDVEFCRPMADIEDIGERMFSENQRTVFRSLP